MVDGEGDTPYVDGLDTFPDESDVSDGDVLDERWEQGTVGDFSALRLKDDHSNRCTAPQRAQRLLFGKHATQHIRERLGRLAQCSCNVSDT